VIQLLAPALLAAGIVASPSASSATSAGAGPAPSSETSSALSLPAVLRRLREESGQAAAARQRTQAAVEALSQARRRPNPSIDLRVENWDLKKDHLAAPWDQLDIFAVASVPVEIGGKRSARSSAAAAGLAGAEADERLAVRDLQLEATALYLGSLKARALVETSRSIQEGIARLVATISRRVEEGYTAEADLLRFRAEEGRLSAQLARSRLSLARSSSQLAALLALDGPIAPELLVEPAWPALPDGDAATLATAALSGRPEIAAGEARVTRARETARLEKARRIPDPSFTGGWKRTGGLDTAVAGIVLPLPVFDSGSAAVRRALAEERAAELELATLRRRLLADTADRVLRARELGERARIAEREFLLPAEGAVTAARASFREGATDILRLVDAERVYAEARRETQELKLDALEASIEALLVLGQEISR
jgi:cobalt-zinc-cadmium efflux system outer membrane protein